MTSEERWKRAVATRKRRLRTRRGKRDHPWRNAQPAQLRQPEPIRPEEEL